MNTITISILTRYVDSYTSLLATNVLDGIHTCLDTQHNNVRDVDGWTVMNKLEIDQQDKEENVIQVFDETYLPDSDNEDEN